MVLNGFLVLQAILTIFHWFIGHLYFMLPGQILFPEIDILFILTDVYLPCK